MANYIKYSTNAQTRALKMGNFWLGPVNDGKGPTSSTGYYTALNPPSGGFTIYANKVSNGPAIFQASNESQLVSITNQIGGTSFTTSAQCLTWYVTQTDKFCVNREYEGIVTNGLVLNLDAGFTPSYPTSGTSWYDLGPSGNTGTLTNGPTFSSTNGGSIVFDGVDDYVSTISSFNITSVSLEVWFLLNSTSSTFVLAQSWLYGGPFNGPGFTIESVGSDLAAAVGGTSDGIYPKYALSNFPLNTPVQTVFTYDLNSNTQILYRNGINVSSTTTGTRTRADSNEPFYLGRANNGGRQFNGRIYTSKIYNRALSATEVLQNYNAQKGRFGL